MEIKTPKQPKQSEQQQSQQKPVKIENLASSKREKAAENPSLASASNTSLNAPTSIQTISSNEKSKNPF